MFQGSDVLLPAQSDATSQYTCSRAPRYFYLHSQMPLVNIHVPGLRGTLPAQSDATSQYPCSRAPRYFYLRSQMHGKVADIRGADPSPGGKVITYEQTDGMSDNQLWYEDRYGIIRSKLNDFVMDSSGMQ